ncbi:MAG TPA: hypothetical protein VG994_02665 [Steroidobacteraceae bacterium]|nr:hypothetical protein [Steroidobacteraceae bacterium]
MKSEHATADGARYQVRPTETWIDRHVHDTARPSAFTDGHLDGFADATNGNPSDATHRFQTWHRKRPVSDFADYERAYQRSYRDAAAFMKRVAA